MAERQNDRMAEWQNGRTAEWQNGMALLGHRKNSFNAYHYPSIFRFLSCIGTAMLLVGVSKY